MVRPAQERDGRSGQPPTRIRPFVLAAKLDTDETIPTLERALMVAFGGANINRFPDQNPRGMYAKSKRISTITSPKTSVI
jgi:hypothetical protein